MIGNHSKLAKKVVAVVYDGVDQTHEFQQLREFQKWCFMKKPSTMVCSGTMPAHVLPDMHKTLEMLPRTILVEFALDRPNVFLATKIIPKREIASAKALESLVPEDLRNWKAGTEYPRTNIPKTIIFVEGDQRCFNITSKLLSLCPEWSRIQTPTGDDGPALTLIREYFAVLSEEGRARNMADFRAGRTRIFVCTEAVGMGIDISDVDRVIQWGGGA